MKKLEIAGPDELEHIQSSAAANSAAFMELMLKKDYAGVQSFFSGTKSLMAGIDKKMTALCLRFEDQQALTSWASRMQTICRHLDNIERNLPHINHRLFNWAEVIPSMGLVLAFRIGAEQTISINEEKAAQLA